MTLRFYLGNEEELISPEYSKTDPAAHYAWCLQGAITEIKHAKNTEEKMIALNKFKQNMNESPATKKMLADVDTLFHQLLSSNAVNSDDYVIEFLTGMMVPDRGYFEYSEQLSPKNSQ